MSFMLDGRGATYDPGVRLNGRSAASTPSSFGSLRKSPACHGVSMWMIELTRNTSTAERSAGRSSAVTLIIKPSLLRTAIAAVDFGRHRCELVGQRRAAAGIAPAAAGPEEGARPVDRQPRGVAAERSPGTLDTQLLFD